MPLTVIKFSVLFIKILGCHEKIGKRNIEYMVYNNCVELRRSSDYFTFKLKVVEKVFFCIHKTAEDCHFNISFVKFAVKFKQVQIQSS